MEGLLQADPQSDNERRTIVTIVNSLSPTSMPLNEFVAWRSRHLPDEKHIVVSLAPAPAIGSGIEFPATVEVVPGAGDAASFRRSLRSTLRQVAATSKRAVVHAHHPRSGALFQSVRLGADRRMPALFSVHNMFSRYPPATRMLSSLNCLRSDHVSFVSHAASDAFPPALRRLRPTAFSVIPNGVDLERVDATLAKVTSGRDRNGFDRRRFELINVAKFTRPEKGHDFLLDVVGRLPGVGLTLVGDGSESPEDREAGTRTKDFRTGFGSPGLVSREGPCYAELLAADLCSSRSGVAGGSPDRGSPRRWLSTDLCFCLTFSLTGRF